MTECDPNRTLMLTASCVLLCLRCLIASLGRWQGWSTAEPSPFSDIGLSTGTFVLGNPLIRCRQHCRFRGPQPRRIVPKPRDDALAVATERHPPVVILMRLGKDAPLGRQIE